MQQRQSSGCHSLAIAIIQLSSHAEANRQGDAASKQWPSCRIHPPVFEEVYSILQLKRKSKEKTGRNDTIPLHPKMRLLHSLVTLPLFALSALHVRAFPQSFQNDAVAQTHELGGSVTTVTTTITARATKDQPGSYYLPLTEKNGVDTPISWSVTVGKHHFGQLPAVRDEETK